MLDWKRIRADFPVTKKRVYFISAGMSPIPTPVFERIMAGYRVLHDEGDIRFFKDLAENVALREKIGRLIAASSDDIVFIQNTSMSMSIVAMSLKNVHGSGFNVVSMMDEFPATTVPLEYQGIEMLYVEALRDRYPIESVLDKVNDETVAVVTSYVQYSSGFRQDLNNLGAELAKRGVMLIVNATQGFPLFPLDMKSMKISALSASCHKWGFAGHVGAVFYTAPAFRERYPSPLAGWLSVDTGDGDFIHTGKGVPFNLYRSAERYSFGTVNLQSINALSTSLDYLAKIGHTTIRARLFELGDLLIEKLNELGVEMMTPVSNREERSSIISFRLGERTAGLFSYLMKNRIYVSYRNGNVRVALNIFNNEEDIRQLIEAILSYLG